MQKRELKLCSSGHTFYKSSQCNTCPVCERENAPSDGILSLLNAPARRALQKEGISLIEQLTQYEESDVANWHGIGKSSIKILKQELEKKQLTFKKNKP